jgi:hypothetical protein
MAVTGNWTLFFDWDCDGGYGNTPMTFKNDGTWTCGEGYSGKWVEGAGMLVFVYNGSQTTYCGNLASQSVTGISAFAAGGAKGCFYMLQEGALPTSLDSKRAVKKPDSAGKP